MKPLKIQPSQNMARQNSIDSKNKKNKNLPAISSIDIHQLTQSIFFDTGDDTLKKSNLKKMNNLASYLNIHLSHTIVLSGHSDPRGSESYNNVLSQERAKTVKEALVALGVQTNRVTTQGYGDQFSIANKGDLAMYQQDRRVNIELKENENFTRTGILFSA